MGGYVPLFASSMAANADRLASLQGKLAARVSGGSPKPGFKRNVRMIRAEIARLQGQEASHVQA